MAGLDGDQPAETMAEYEDWQYPQRATEDEQHDANPADAIAVEGPEFLSIRVCRQIRFQQPYHGESGEDPAVVAILAFTGAQVAATEARNDRHDQRCNSHDGQRRIVEESS